MTTRWIIGLSSGACADGVDAVLLEAEGVGLELQTRLLPSLHQSYGRDLRRLIRQATVAEPADFKQIALLHRLLGETFAAAARQVADRAGVPLYHVQCLGCPGHPFTHETE